MKFSIRFSDQIVGTLVILALAMLIFVIFMIGTSQRWFVRDYQYKTYFSSAQGVSVNMAIQFKGFTIGYVKKITLADDNKVEVIFTIFEEYTQRVTEGSVVEVQISPIGLGNAFVFHPGLGKELIPEGMIIPEINSYDAKRLKEEGLLSRPEIATDNISAILAQAKTLLEIINAAIEGTPDAQYSEIGKIVRNLETTTKGIADISKSLAAQLDPILDNVKYVTDGIADPSGTIMSALDGDGTLYTSLEDTIASLAGIIASLKKTVDFIPSQLPQLGVLISQLNVTLNSVQDVLIAVSNNPLIKKGIPEQKESNPGGAADRNQDMFRRQAE